MGIPIRYSGRLAPTHLHEIPVQGSPGVTVHRSKLRQALIQVGKNVKHSRAPLWREAKFWLLSRLAWVAINLTMLTCRMRVEGKHALQKHWQRGGAIYVVWHAKTFVPMFFFRGRGAYALVSLSRDGRYQSTIARFFGFHLIRGSSNKGAIGALRRSVSVLADGNPIWVTPDGPRGPSRRVQVGVIGMASLSRAPIIPVGVAADRCYYLRTWDCHMVPKPFATTVLFFGDPIHIPVNLPKQAVAEYAERVRKAIEAAEDGALSPIRQARAPSHHSVGSRFAR